MFLENITPVPTKVGHLIQVIRKEKGINQSDLASLTGLRQPNLSRIERGLTVPRLSTLKKIAIALDVSIEVLSEAAFPARTQAVAEAL